MKRKRLNIIEFTTEVLGVSLSPAQEVIQRTHHGLPLANAEQLALFQEMTGLEEYPGHPFREVVIAGGVRGGKDTRLLIPEVLYQSVYGNWKVKKAGETSRTMLLMAQNLRGVEGAAFDALMQTLRQSPLLLDVAVTEKKEEITFKNGVTVRCLPNTVDAARGLTSPVACLDEVAFWAGPGKVNSADEIYATLQTRQFGLPGSKLMLASSFYLKDGLFWNLYKENWGRAHPDRIVFKAPTLRLNPGPETEAHLAQQRRLMDSARFRRDFECEPAEGSATFLSRELIDRAVVEGRSVLARAPRILYAAGCDMAGTGRDPFAIAIVHQEPDGRLVQDFTKAWTKRAGEETDVFAIAREMAAICKSYGVTMLLGDAWAKGWPRRFLKDQGIAYIETDDRNIMPRGLRYTRSECYLHLERLLLQPGKVELLDEPKQIRELALLDRVYGAGGSVTIDHPSAGSDDRANALAVALVAAELKLIRARAATRREGMSYGQGEEESSLEELIAWGRKRNMINAETLRIIDDGRLAKLDREQREQLRLDLAERRLAIERPMELRLKNAGIWEDRHNDDEVDDGDDDGDTYLDEGDALLATLGGPTMPWGSSA